MKEMIWPSMNPAPEMPRVHVDTRVGAGTWSEHATGRWIQAISYDRLQKPSDLALPGAYREKSTAKTALAYLADIVCARPSAAPGKCLKKY